MGVRQEDAPSTAIAALKACPTNIIPSVHNFLRLLAVLPVTTVEAERWFSKVTRTTTGPIGEASDDLGAS